MTYECPECGNQLGERSANISQNVKRRELESIWDRYVCRNCEVTFSRREVEDLSITNEWFWK